MTKKNKQKADNKNKILSDNGIKSYIPSWLIYPFLFIWIIVVLRAYYTKFPIGSLSEYFHNINFILNGNFVVRSLENLKNIVFSLLLFLAAFGFGDVLFHILSKSKFGEEINKLGFTAGSLFAIFWKTVLGLGIICVFAYVSALLNIMNKAYYLIVLIIFSIHGIRSFKSNFVLQIGRLGLSEKVLVLAIAVIQTFVLFAALCPEVFYDSQFYQLGLMNDWIRNGTNFSPNIPASFFPLNINLFFLVGLIVNNEITAKLIHYCCSILSLVGIYTMAKHFFNRKIGLLSVLIYVSIPLVIIVSHKTAVEMGISMFEIAMIFALIMYFQNKGKILLVLAGIICGFSMGSKYTSIVFSFLPAVAMLIIYEMKTNKNIKGIIKSVLLFTIISISIASIWYIKNLIVTGNPVFPFFADKIGSKLLRATDVYMKDPGHPKFSIYNYLLFIWPLTMGTLQQESFPGPIFLVFIPLIILFFKNADKKIKYLLIYLLVNVVLWSYLGRFYLRYIIPNLALVSIVYAYFIEKQKVSRSIKNVILIIILFTAYSNMLFANRIIKFSNNPLLYVLGIQSESEYLSTSKPSYPNPYYHVVDYANKNLPSTSRILFIGEARGLYCKRQYLVNGAGEYSYFIEPLKKSNNEDEYYRLLKDKGVTHLLLNVPELKRLYVYGNLYWNKEEFKIFDKFWKKYVVEIYRDIADLSVPQRGIISMKKQNPVWWENYAKNPFNYVFLYEILDEESALKPHEVPYNILADKRIYPEKDWQKLTK